jgi:hypothetical protein
MSAPACLNSPISNWPRSPDPMSPARMRSFAAPTVEAAKTPKKVLRSISRTSAGRIVAFEPF